MDRNKVEEKIKVIMSRIFNIPINGITSESSPKTIQTWKGRKHLDLVSALEDEFHIKFESGEEETFVSFKVVFATVLAYLE